MTAHEYRVVPAPRRGMKGKGPRRPEDRFAQAVESEMNRMAADGWEFVRSDTLPCERKSNWFSGPVTVFETLLVFRRALAEEDAQATRTTMPPSVALTPPASVASPAPAASRLMPLPDAPLPANTTATKSYPPVSKVNLAAERSDPDEIQGPPSPSESRRVAE